MTTVTYRREGDTERRFLEKGECGYRVGWLREFAGYRVADRSDLAGTLVKFRLPQLTYDADHPGEALPSLHFAVEVTE